MAQSTQRVETAKRIEISVKTGFCNQHLYLQERVLTSHALTDLSKNEEVEMESGSLYRGKS